MTDNETAKKSSATTTETALAPVLQKKHTVGEEHDTAIDIDIDLKGKARFH
jgi:hypothetical protein